jgi:hypothetical protein
MPCKNKCVDVPGKVFLALFFDFDVQQNKGVHPKIRVLAHVVVETVGPPGVGEEDEGDGLTEVVQLQTASANGVHDRRVVYDTGRDAERARPEEDVRVRCRAKRVSDDEESNILSVRFSQDLVTSCLDHVAVCEDE